MRELHGIIFSYEKRNELYELAEKRTAASLPFGGRYRCVDFVLSNLVNAGVQDVGVVLHGRYQSLLDHLGSGKSWDLSRKRGGLKILPPFAYQRAFLQVCVHEPESVVLACGVVDDLVVQMEVACLWVVVEVYGILLAVERECSLQDVLALVVALIFSEGDVA